jgi:hypothetical protein
VFSIGMVLVMHFFTISLLIFSFETKLTKKSNEL